MDTRNKLNLLELEKELCKHPTVTQKLDYLKKKQEGNPDTLHSLILELPSKHFPDKTNNVEFTYWFLIYNAEVCFKNHISNQQFKNKLKSGLKEQYLRKELKEIEAREKEAINSITTETSTNANLDHETIYNSDKGFFDYMASGKNKLSKAEVIETLRILDGNYYKKKPTTHSYRVIRSTEVLTYFRHILLKNHLQFLLSELKIKERLSLKEIAIIHAYKVGKSLTQKEAKTLAKEYGWASGHKLYQYVNYFISRTNRKGDEGTLVKNKNKQKIIEGILHFLNNEEKNSAMDDLAILANIIKTKYN
ncbi:hypothetical protein [Maribacter sp. MAR_2009_72]|uniref:hypothetical protein n=1 Tax=Maribacter sp. MAR_2009_72 TaxID=1250050 RepID=UPI001199B24E|nr:hypothetical protein [Maribacter sp. MAR_2009_72]TVZ16408.1 hypothetical protein JM81_2668 [Maribacter sp. MAR_2009_72]